MAAGGRAGLVVGQAAGRGAAEDAKVGGGGALCEGGVAVAFVEHLLPAVRAGRDERDGRGVAGDAQAAGGEQGEGVVEGAGGDERVGAGDVDLRAQPAELDAVQPVGGAGVDDLRQRPIRAGEGGDGEEHAGICHAWFVVCQREGGRMKAEG